MNEATRARRQRWPRARPATGVALVAAASLSVLFGACAAPEEREAPTKSVTASGFTVEHDGVELRELDALFSELAFAKDKILAILGPAACPGEFRPWDERGGRSAVGCPPPLGPIHIRVLSGNGRCHADETGVTVLRSHLDRKDATHELVHYLAGGSWRPIDEGLAVWITERLHGPAWGVSVDVRTRCYIDLNMDEGLERERLRRGMSRADYDMAGSLVHWLVDEYGWEKVHALNRGAPGAYHDGLGLSESELLAKWRSRIRMLDIRQDASYYRFRAHLTRMSGQ